MSQDRIILLSGKLFDDVRIGSDDGAFINYEIEKKNGDLKMLQVYKGDVFSIQRAGEEEEVFYVQDLVNGYEMTETDLRHYIYGESDARNGYNPWPSTIGGFVFGAGGTIFLESGFLPLTLPVIYSLGMQIPYIRIKEETISDMEYTMNPNYKDGYNQTARSKKLIHNLAGTFAGVVVGAVIYETTQ